MENIDIKTEPIDYPTDIKEQDSPSEFSDIVIPDIETDSNSNTADVTIKTEIEDSSEDTNEDISNNWFFDSDHPALKADPDYQNYLRIYSGLLAQRKKAVQDVDRLYELREEALADPFGFVERLQNKEDLNIPGPQIIHPLPPVDWSKYSLTGSASAFGRRQLTRLSAKAAQDQSSSTKQGAAGKSSDGFNEQQKSQKSGQYWSEEEQKRLDELLEQFPPEEVESRRWEKIANCLENRTPTQVASRVQKYFIKLMKAGKPIPGRTPNSTYLRKPRRNVIRQQPSTFLVSHSLPVYMPDVDEDYSQRYYHSQNMSNTCHDIKMELSDDEDISPEFKNTPDFQEYKLLKKVLKNKLRTCGVAEHVGYKCSHCKADPIIGVRWHCTVCKPPNTVDFCDDCVDNKLEMENHSMDHRLEEIPNANSAPVDTNYTGDDYNYLDPNYMPAE